MPALDAAVIEATTFNPVNSSAKNAAGEETVPVLPAPDINELAFEIGLWLSGLESFLSVRSHSFAEENRAKAASRDWAKEFRLTHSTLLLCSRMMFQLGKTIKDKEDSADEIDLDFGDNSFSQQSFEISTDEIYKLSQILKSSILLNESLLRAAPLKFGEWTAWSGFLYEKLKTARAFDILIETAERQGEQFLPEILRNLLDTKPMPLTLEADLRLVLPRFGKILKWLSVVDRMLKQDEPLKPSLLIFSRIYEQIQEMMAYVNNRLLRLSEEEDALFGSLDGAAYTASIELRKVYQHELAGLAEIRQTPLVYAKIETAYSLLNDSFQQTLLTFAQLIDPEIEPTKLFPNFQSKLKQSLILRQNLWRVFKSVQKAEQNPEKDQLESLRRELTDFLNTTLYFFFYKDMETVERFIEEVLVTTDKKDLVPILHRFGAYLETLFGQVNMRAVLVNHPFEYPSENKD
ncbi:MAG TPA: hypothetical protein VK308_07445 [Pyrinomonadaceae bacterium]|nr:hypothetical protein [Pyrinomonadaceae bacterium]